MRTQSLFSVLATAGLSLAVTACGPQDEPSADEMNPATVTSHLASPRLSPEEAHALAAQALGAEEDSVQVLGITYVRPHGVRPALRAYEVLVTRHDRDGLPVEELVYVDANDGSVLFRIPRDEAAASGAFRGE